MIHTSYTSKRRLCLICFSLFFCFFLILGKLYHLQIHSFEHYEKLASNQHRDTRHLPAERGTITDRHGKALSISHRGWCLWSDPAFLVFDKLDSFLETCSEDLLIDPVEIKKKLEKARAKKKRYIRLKRHLTKSQSDAIEALVEKTPGLYLESEWMRSYPAGQMLSSLLGVVGNDHNGLTGLEAYYENKLKGVPGKKVVYRDASRKKREVHVREEVQPKKGHHLELTIDLGIQTFLYSAMKEGVDQCKPKSASGIVVDVRTGEILAVLTLPSHNPGDKIKKGLEGLKPRFFVDTFEPGSTIKPIVYASVLQYGKGTPAEKIFCGNGAQRFGSRVLHDVHGYGKLSLEEVIVKSSNIGAAHMGIRLGEKRLYSVLNRLGFGRKSYLPIHGEPAGTLRKIESWSSLSITSIPMGHEMSVTMTQMAMAYAAIGNGGYLLQPILERKIFSPNGQVIRKRSRVSLNRIFSKSVCQKTMRALEQVVEKGTAKRAKSKWYRIAGKTGTTEKIVNGKYSKDKNIGSFICLAPASSPVIAVMVMMDEPEGVQYGGTVAGPVAKKVVESTLQYMNIPFDQNNAGKAI